MPGEHARVEYNAFTKLAPAAHAALLAVGKAVDEAGLEKALSELVKLRVSQINGCAFCVRLHLNTARTLGIDAAKLDMVAAWRDAGVFSAREAAALGWAEQLTRIAAEGAPDRAYAALRDQFSETEAVLLTVTIGLINNWNRVAAGLRFSPPV